MNFLKKNNEFYKDNKHFMSKTIFKTTIAIFILSLTLISCNKDESNNPSNDSDYYVTAKIQGAGYDLNYENHNLILAMNIEVQGTVTKQISVIPEDENTNFGFILKYEYYNTIEPETKYELFGISIENNDESKMWMAPGIIAALQGTTPDANFTITKETDTYIEGTFSFIGNRTDPDTWEIVDTINVTNGKFKAKKTY